MRESSFREGAEKEQAATSPRHGHCINRGGCQIERCVCQMTCGRFPAFRLQKDHGNETARSDPTPSLCEKSEKKNSGRNSFWAGATKWCLRNRGGVILDEINESGQGRSKGREQPETEKGTSLWEKRVHKQIRRSYQSSHYEK